ncbi:hypothetical protein [Pseudomonas sp. FP198]|uniref:hypothetical protein n=1 Tax=Pseudomonas sp. FP198 TaxID=2954084 RepID=UPI0027357606|nr:hypothetical protein [Pseudomonas sp. FP198]WLG93725.1 hypothetical protein PSH78_14985 [Pseudomonas sp. FP198]
MIDPSTGQPYLPTPAYFLGCFDIYDREETLGEELAKFDPNNPTDREILILNYSLSKRWKITHRQKFALYKSLEEALQDGSYDFQALLEHGCQEYSSLPCGWDTMNNPRAFFEDIYRLATTLWADDLKKAETEDQSTWDYI